MTCQHGESRQSETCLTKRNDKPLCSGSNNHRRTTTRIGKSPCSNSDQRDPYLHSTRAGFADNRRESDRLAQVAHNAIYKVKGFSNRRTEACDEWVNPGRTDVPRARLRHSWNSPTPKNKEDRKIAPTFRGSHIWSKATHRGCSLERLEAGKANHCLVPRAGSISSRDVGIG